MKWFYIVSAIVVIGLSACPFVLLKPDADLEPQLDESGSCATTSPSTSTRRKPVVVVSTYASKVRTIDPAAAGDEISHMIQGNFYEGLYGYHFLKRPAEIIPLLAESMPDISADGKTYTIKIKKGIVYKRNPCFGKDEKGNPKTREVVAEDFVLQFKRILDSHIETQLACAFIKDKFEGAKEFTDATQGYAKGDFSRYNLPLKAVEALDHHTLRIHLNSPYPQLIYVLAITDYCPIPHEVVDYYLSTKDDGNGGRQPIPINERTPLITESEPAAAVGTGAYYLSKFVSGGDIELIRNPDYRDDYYPSDGSPEDRKNGLLDDAGKKVPFIDVNRLIYVPEPTPDWNMFLARRTDVSGIPAQMFPMYILPGAELSNKLSSKGIKLFKYTKPSVYWFGFNMSDRVVGASKSLRQAMSLAFDVEMYLKVMSNDRGKRALNIIPSSFPEYPHFNPSPYARFDIDAARQKLADAIKELRDDGVIGDNDGIPELTVDLTGRDETDRRMGEFIRLSFKKIGLNIKIELNDWPTLQRKVDQGQTQIFTMGWGADYPDPQNFLQLFYSPNIAEQTNHTHYSNPKFDKLYESTLNMLPCPERTAIFSQMVDLINEDCPLILLTEPMAFVLLQPWVFNYNPHPFSYGTFKYRRIDADMKERMLAEDN